jgi:hypothetical protein
MRAAAAFKARSTASVGEEPAPSPASRRRAASASAATSAAAAPPPPPAGGDGRARAPAPFRRTRGLAEPDGGEGAQAGRGRRSGGPGGARSGGLPSAAAAAAAAAAVRGSPGDPPPPPPPPGEAAPPPPPPPPPGAWRIHAFRDARGSLLFHVAPADADADDPPGGGGGRGEGGGLGGGGVGGMARILSSEEVGAFVRMLLPPLQGRPEGHEEPPPPRLPPRSWSETSPAPRGRRRWTEAAEDDLASLGPAAPPPGQDPARGSVRVTSDPDCESDPLVQCLRSWVAPAGPWERSSAEGGDCGSDRPGSPWTFAPSPEGGHEGAGVDDGTDSPQGSGEDSEEDDDEGEDDDTGDPFGADSHVQAQSTASGVSGASTAFSRLWRLPPSSSARRSGARCRPALPFFRGSRLGRGKPAAPASSANARRGPGGPPGEGARGRSRREAAARVPCCSDTQAATADETVLALDRACGPPLPEAFAASAMNVLAIAPNLLATDPTASSIYRYVVDPRYDAGGSHSHYHSYRCAEPLALEASGLASSPYGGDPRSSFSDTSRGGWCYGCGSPGSQALGARMPVGPTSRAGAEGPLKGPAAAAAPAWCFAAGGAFPGAPVPGPDGRDAAPSPPSFSPAPAREAFEPPTQAGTRTRSVAKPIHRAGGGFGAAVRSQDRGDWV